MSISYEQFIERTGMTMQVKRRSLGRAPRGEWERTAKHYTVTLVLRNGNTYQTPFSMGSLCTEEPTIREVLETELVNCRAYSNSQTPEEWAREWGKGNDGFAAARNIYRKMREFLGEDDFTDFVEDIDDNL